MQLCVARLLSGKLSLDLLELQNRFKIKAVGLVGAAHSLVTTPVTIAQSSAFGRSGVQECERRSSGKVSASGGRLGFGCWGSGALCTQRLRNLALLKGVSRLVSPKALTDLVCCLRCGRPGRMLHGFSVSATAHPWLPQDFKRCAPLVSHKVVYSQRQEIRFVLSESEAIFLTSLCVPESGVPVPGATHGRPASPSSG